MTRPDHIPSYRPLITPSCSPSHTPYSQSTRTPPLPHTHPTTHISLPPPPLPFAPPLLHLTHRLYQATIGGHMGHTVRVFKARSNSWFQYQMKLCIQSYAGVKKRFQTPQLTHPFSLCHYS